MSVYDVCKEQYGYLRKGPGGRSTYFGRLVYRRAAAMIACNIFFCTWVFWTAAHPHANGVLSLYSVIGFSAVMPGYLIVEAFHWRRMCRRARAAAYRICPTCLYPATVGNTPPAFRCSECGQSTEPAFLKRAWNKF